MTVAIVGSGPGSRTNPIDFIDAHDIVVRVNNYKLFPETGKRTDVHYSFYGRSVTKTADELKRDGVKICMCKCPDAHAIESDWHRRNNKMIGVDFRWIYEFRRDFWFCETYVPALNDFIRTFKLLGRRIPTTGFSAIREVLACQPKSLYLTGFDFFRSGLHNVDERWRIKNHDDPVGHAPERERAWLASNIDSLPVTVDRPLAEALNE